MRMLTKAISLGTKRPSRMRRSSGNNHGTENSMGEHLVAAQRRDQKFQTFTHDTNDNHDTGKEAVKKITALAVGKKFKETRLLHADKRSEAGFAEEPHAEGQNTIGESQVRSVSKPGFRVDKVKRAQGQPPMFPGLSLNQVAVAITIAKPIRESKPIQRKRAPKKKNLPVQSDARTGASEIAHKDQGTGRSSYYFPLFLI